MTDYALPVHGKERNENMLTRFTHQEMSWKKVILLAVLTAVLTAVLNLTPAFRDTSFQDIAINPECWLLFAMLIIVNCPKWQEAAVKTFVFFLISQPLIYLIQVPFNSMGFQLFQYYKFWFIVTVLTLPGAVIAWQIRRGDWLSVAVLSVATGFLGYMAAGYFWNVKANFPHHLLSLCFCLALALFLTFALLSRKGHRAVAIAVLLISLAVSLFLLKPTSAATIVPGDGNWTWTIEDPSIAGIGPGEDQTLSVTAKGKGTTLLTLVNESGDRLEYYITVSNGSVYINQIDPVK